MLGSRIRSVLEILIIVTLIFIAISLIVFPPPMMGPVTELLGSRWAVAFYSSLYVIQAGMLALFKVTHKVKKHKNTLMFIYLTGTFTFLLQLILGGVTLKSLDNLLVSLMAGICWLSWKFKTEYIDLD